MEYVCTWMTFMYGAYNSRAWRTPRSIPRLDTEVWVNDDPGEVCAKEKYDIFFG